MSIQFRSLVGVWFAGLVWAFSSEARAIEWMPSSDSKLGEDCITALAYCPEDDLVYAIDGTRDLLVTIEPRSGIVHRIGPLGFQVVTGLAATKRGLLYGVDGYSDQLIRIDRATGKGTAIGSLGFQSIQSLAFDGSGRLLGIDTTTDQLVEIDLHSGLATAIGTIEAPSIFGMTCGTDGSLFAVDLATCGLYRIDAQNAETEHIGRIQESLVSMSGLTIGKEGELIAYDSIQDSLYLLETSTASPKSVTKLAHLSLRGWLAWLIPDHWGTQLLLLLSGLTSTVALGLRMGRYVAVRVGQWRCPANSANPLPV